MGKRIVMEVVDDQGVSGAVAELERALGAEVLRTFGQSARRVFKDGMTREEFRSRIMADMGMGERAAPKWVHDAVDALWDYFMK